MAFSWGFVLVKTLELPAATIAGCRLLIAAIALAMVAAAIEGARRAEARQQP